MAISRGFRRTDSLMALSTVGASARASWRSRPARRAIASGSSSASSSGVAPASSSALQLAQASPLRAEDQLAKLGELLRRRVELTGGGRLPGCPVVGHRSALVAVLPADLGGQVGEQTRQGGPSVLVALSSSCDRVSSAVRRSASRVRSAAAALDWRSSWSRSAASARLAASSSLTCRCSSARIASLISAASALISSPRLVRSAASRSPRAWVSLRMKASRDSTCRAKSARSASCSVAVALRAPGGGSRRPASDRRTGCRGPCRGSRAGPRRRWARRPGCRRTSACRSRSGPWRATGYMR